ITFVNNLTGQNVAQIVSTTAATATMSTAINGHAPTAGELQDSLSTIPPLNGNVIVNGSISAGYTLTFKNELAQTNVAVVEPNATGDVVATHTANSQQILTQSGSGTFTFNMTYSDNFG